MKRNGSRKMSIGINGSMLDEHPTGVGVYSFNLINHLSAIETVASNSSVKVFSPTRISLNEEVTIIKLPGVLQSSRYGKLAAILRFCWNNFYYPFQAAGFDLLISPTTHGSIVLNNQIITIHDLLSLNYTNISAHQRMYFRFFLPLLLRKARLIIAVSEHTKQDIIKHFRFPAESIKVIHNGYDHLLYTPASDDAKPINTQYGVSNYFLAVGPTYPHKNFERLIESWDALPGDVKRAHPLVIAGGKPGYVARLKTIVSTIPMNEQILFLGYVPIQLMPALYREAMVLVFPSLYEGFGIPLLEAMGCGCPVMTSNTSSMPEVGADAVLYFDPMNAGEITAGMLRIQSDAVLRSELIEKGLMRATRFSWFKMAESFSSVIHSLN